MQCLESLKTEFLSTDEFRMELRISWNFSGSYFPYWKKYFCIKVMNAKVFTPVQREMLKQKKKKIFLF